MNFKGNQSIQFSVLFCFFFFLSKVYLFAGIEKVNGRINVFWGFLDAVD